MFKKMNNNPYKMKKLWSKVNLNYRSENTFIIIKRKIRAHIFISREYFENKKLITIIQHNLEYSRGGGKRSNIIN